jgi:hypothetical protein
MLPVGSRRLSSHQSWRCSLPEKGGAVKLSHVADPVGFEDRFAARDRQRVESADWPLCVLLEIVEKRGVIAILDAFEDRKMQFQKFLDCIEDAAQSRCIGTARQLLDLAVGQQVG